jgi:multiple sugar transport system ATP-binding protein
VQVGTPREIYENPVDSYVATRLGAPGINLVPHALFPEVRTPAVARTIGVRTEHVHIRKATNGTASGTVTWIEHLGDQNHLHVSLADGELVTLGDPDAGLAVGDRVSIELTNPLFFDQDGRRVIP